MGAWLLRGATAPERKTMAEALTLIFIGGTGAAYALWAVRGAKRANRYRRTGRWY